jgi:hypothetical protein
VRIGIQKILTKKSMNFFGLIFSRNPSDTLRYNYLDNDDSAVESLMAKHRKYGTSILQQTESDNELKNTSKERQARSRDDERYEQNGRKRRSQSLVGLGFLILKF